MKISEMEYHHGEYTSLEGKINKMLENREFPAIFSICVESFPHIVPAIQYRKKREINPETPEWSAFDIICTYAPPLFEHAIIESLFQFVQSTRLLAKHDNNYLQAVETAIAYEEVARVFWNSIEHKPNQLQKDICNTLGDNRSTVLEIIDVWERCGVIVCKRDGIDSRVMLRTRFDNPVEGRCYKCGVWEKGYLERFLAPICCKSCGAEGYYHIKYLSS